jgi:alpha-L-fucosidase
MWDASCGIPGCYATPATVRAEWAADSAYVMGQLTELMTNYGEIPLLIFDGYSWDMGHWAFPYQCVRALVKRLQPNCIITDHNGLLNEPWEQDIADFEEPLGIKVPSGNTYASQQENTISGDWFWDSTAANISKLKTVSFITQHLDTLEPRWCNFLLNCPPNKTGLLDTAIVTRIAQVGAAWSPDTLRAALPEQPAMIERPITPISATASSNSSTAVNAIDNTNDYSGGHAQSLWTSSGSLPQYVTLDLGKVYDTIDMLMYQPRRESSTTGNITSYRVLVSTDGTTFTQVDSGTWAANVLVKRSQFQRQSAQYVRLEARAVNGSTLAVINTIAVGAHLSYSQPVNVYQGTASSAALPSEAGTYKAMGRVLLDKRLSGNNVAVTVYDLSGKVKGTKIISGKSFDLQKDIGVSDGVYIIKINHTR